MQNLKIVEFKNNLSNGFLAYPINELDEEFFVANGHPPSGKYAKMLTRSTPMVNDIWKQSLTIKQTLHNLEYVVNTIFTDRGIECLTEQYAALNVEMQDLNKELKKTKQEQDIATYYARYDTMHTVNVFDMLVDDLNTLMPDIHNRNAVYNTKYNDTNVINHDVEMMKEHFKNSTKEYKAKKAEMLKKQKQK